MGLLEGIDWHLVGLSSQTVIFLAGVYKLVIHADVATKEMKENIKAMKEELKKLTEVVTTQAVQATEIKNLTTQVTLIQRTVEDLRRGDGFVQGRRGIDREFP
jgi:endonuclease IV